jgi:hypothetical protein
MKIIKFSEFITEKIHDTPESYISTVLNRLRTKIVNMFEKDDSDEEVSFQDLNVNLESADVSKYSKLYDSLTVKFSDQDFAYTMIIIIDIKEAIPEDLDKNFDIDDIKNCYIKFKKYDLDHFDLIGNIDKNIEIKNIDKEFIIDLKLELDETFGLDDGIDELGIETE